MVTSTISAITIVGTGIGPGSDEDQTLVVELIPGVALAPAFDPTNPAAADCLTDRIRLKDGGNVLQDPVFSIDGAAGTALVDALDAALARTAGSHPISSTEQDEHEEYQRIEIRDATVGRLRLVSLDANVADLLDEIATQLRADLVTKLGLSPTP